MKRLTSAWPAMNCSATRDAGDSTARHSLEGRSRKHQHMARCCCRCASVRMPAHVGRTAATCWLTIALCKYH